MQISNSEIKAMNVLSQKTAGRVGGVRTEEYSSCLFHLLVTSGMSERLFFNADLADCLFIYLIIIQRGGHSGVEESSVGRWKMAFKVVAWLSVSTRGNMAFAPVH